MELASGVTRTSTVASVREGRAARGERCAASSAWEGAALHGSAYRGWGRGCEGAIPCSADGGERSLSHTVRHFSAARVERPAIGTFGSGDTLEGRRAWCARSG